MNRLAYILTLFFLMNALSDNVLGEEKTLAWITEKQEQRAEWSDRELVYYYQFVNNSNKPITLRDVAVSCGCTELDRTILKTYQPGEKGVLTAKYQIGERTGQRVESLMIETDESGGRVHKLILIANLPELVKMQPSFVHWISSEPVSTKVMQLEWTGPESAELVSAEPNEKGWQVKVKQIASGKSWELQITPPTTNDDVIIQIKLKFKNAKTGEREVIANALLQPDPKK